MRKIYLLLFALPCFVLNSFAQLYTNAFTGVSACPTNGNVPTVAANATGTPLSRSTIICATAASVFNSTTLNNTASVSDASYIEFSLTANAGFQLNLTSVSFFRQGSGTAPNRLEVRYSTDGFATSTSWGAAPLTPTTGSVTTWDFADFSSADGGTVTFRIYPYGTQRADLGATAAAASGTFRLDDVTVNGSLSSAGGGPVAPSVGTPTSTNITMNSAVLGGTISSDGGSSISSRGITYSTTDNTPEIGEPGVTTIIEGGTTVGVFTTTVNSLPEGSTIYFRAYATNSTATGYSNTASFSTLKSEPSNHVTSFACGTTTSSAIPLTWFDATGTTIPDGYLIKWSSVGYTDITDPVDGTAIPNGSGALNVAAGIQAATITGLLQNTTYYFKIYSYTNANATINYKTDGTIPETSCVTMPGRWEEFEVGSKAGYGAGDVMLASGSWNFNEGLLGTDANDRKNGTKAARIRNAGIISMNFDIPTGVGYVTINHASYGSDAASTWHLEASTDGGSTWTTFVGPDVTTTSTTLTAETFLVKVASAVRLRIVKTDATSARLNIDDISFTAYSPTLPVRFSTLKAIQKGNSIDVYWSNSTEENVVSYLIERSSNGRSFSSIGQTNARANNGSKADYNFVDATPFNGDNFYRIKASETTGKIIYSSIVRINTVKKVSDLVVYPNPLRGNDLNIQLSHLPAGKYTITLYTSFGQAVSSKAVSHTGGSSTVTMTSNQLPAGVYYVQMNGNVNLRKQVLIVK